MENVKAAISTPVNGVTGLLIPTFPALLHPQTDPRVVSAIAKCKFSCFAHGDEWVNTLKRMGASKEHMGIQLCQAARAERAVISATHTKAERSVYTAKATTPSSQITEACLALATALCGRLRFTAQGADSDEKEKSVREYLRFLTSKDTVLPKAVITGIEASKIVKVIPDGAPYLNGDGIRTFVSLRWVEASRVEVANGTTARARKIAQYRKLAELFLEEVEGKVFITDQDALAAKRAERKAGAADE